MGDLISDALSNMMNAERTHKTQCVLKPVSNLLREVLKIIKAKGYIGEYEYVDNGRGGFINVNLLGRLNKINSIRPRFPCNSEDYETYERRYLPAKSFGYLIVSTSKGLMTHGEAKQKNLGGVLVAYFY